MGTCIVRKVLPPEEIKKEKKRKSKIMYLAIGQVALFILLFALAFLCVLKWGAWGEAGKLELTLPNFCFPWWGMAVALVFSFVGVATLTKRVKENYHVKNVMLVLFVLDATMFYFGLFYFASLFLAGGVACVCLLGRKTRLKQRLTFLPFFVLICYILLVVYFFALIN